MCAYIFMSVTQRVHIRWRLFAGNSFRVLPKRRNKLSTFLQPRKISGWIFIASARLDLTWVELAWVGLGWVRFIARFDKPLQCCVNCCVAYRACVRVCVCDVIVHWKLRSMQISLLFYFLFAIFHFAAMEIICGQCSYVPPYWKWNLTKSVKHAMVATMPQDLHVCVRVCVTCNVVPGVCVTFILWQLMMRALWEQQKRLNKEIQAVPPAQATFAYAGK